VNRAERGPGSTRRGNARRLQPPPPRDLRIYLASSSSSSSSSSPSPSPSPSRAPRTGEITCEIVLGIATRSIRIRLVPGDAPDIPFRGARPYETARQSAISIASSIAGDHRSEWILSKAFAARVHFPESPESPGCKDTWCAASFVHERVDEQSAGGARGSSEGRREETRAKRGRLIILS